MNYGESLDQGLVARDAFYLFQELFEFSAFSTAQFLNMIGNNISNASSSGRALDSGSKQTNLLYIQDILERQERCLQENIEAIKSEGMSWWHWPEDEKQRKKCQHAAESLRRDYDALLGHTAMLRGRCQGQIKNLATQVLLADSEKAMIQANEVAKLTKMAFFFIPLSFTCGLFGMNVSPIVGGAPPIWVWIIVTVPIVCLSLIFLRWSPRELFYAWKRPRA